ncbi:MAG: hypothetical protein WDM87_00325 [Terracidiphilus sp.]
MAMPLCTWSLPSRYDLSGQQVKGASIDIASKRTEIMLGKLGVTHASIRRSQKPCHGEDSGCCSRNQLRLAPVVDGVVLSRDPFTPDAPPLSASLPMILGNVHDETAVPTPKPGTLNWDDAPARAAQCGRYLSWDLLR